MPAQGARLLAEAEFEEFAPCPCVCYQCFIPDKARSRSYARVYDNRLEINNIIFPCLCCSKERCIRDSSVNHFFDQPPSRAGMCCYVIPCICCGPPVVFTHKPRCCCAIIDTRPCFGEMIMHAPCNCYDLRCCLACGASCYQCYASPLIVAVKNGEQFLGKWRGALEVYEQEKGIPSEQVTRFRLTQDRFCDCDKAREIQAIAPSPVQGMTMDRGTVETSATAVPIGYASSGRNNSPPPLFKAHAEVVEDDAPEAPLPSKSPTSSKKKKKSSKKKKESAAGDGGDGEEKPKSSKKKKRKPRQMDEP